jgi:uncharacterized RDD family membrane protein YckC
VAFPAHPARLGNVRADPDLEEQHTMSTGSNQPPGWYYAQGDPPGTQRYWDGAQWVGGPQPIGGPQPGGFTMPSPGGMPGGSMVGGVAGRPLANPGTRIVARLIDTAILIVAAIIVGAIVGFDNQLGLQFLTGVLGIGYELAFTALKGGTPGKMVMGIGVVTTDGTYPPGWGPAAIRWVVTAIPCIGTIVFLVSLVLLFTDPEHRTVGDRAANTRVVKVK